MQLYNKIPFQISNVCNIKNNKQNRAITRMFNKGVKGELINKAQKLRDERKKNREKR